MTNCATGHRHSPKDFDFTGVERFPLGQPGYVYVIQWGEDGPVKIGMAVEPRLRLNELQCANWNTLTLRAVVPVIEQMALVERTAHQLAQGYRLRGEWFDIEPHEAVECILAAAVQCSVDVWPLAETLEQIRASKQVEQGREDELGREFLRIQRGLEPIVFEPE